MPSLKSHRCTATRARAGATTAATVVIVGLTSTMAVAAPVNPLIELSNCLDSASNFPVNVAAPGGTELPGGGFEVPDSISLPSSLDENTDPDVPKPTSCHPDQIAHPYLSGAATDNWLYFYVVRPPVGLEKNHPEVIGQSLETVTRISNAAKNDPQVQELTFDGDYLDLPADISTVFGINLGQHSHDAFNEGRLPKAKALLSGNPACGGGLASSTFFEKHVYDYDRPFMVVPEYIEHYCREGQDGPYSVTPSYSSGYTNKAAWISIMLTTMLLGVAPQIRARAFGAGYPHPVMGVYYLLDVIGDRMMSNQVATNHWVDSGFCPFIEEAMGEPWTELKYRCDDTVTNCAIKGTPYISTVAIVQQYTEHITHDLKQVGPANESAAVPKRYAGLLEVRFSQLTEEQCSSILAQAAIPSGHPLDHTDGEGQHVRMNLARALATNVVVNADGSVIVTN